jgi:hypothetical protein
MGLNWQAKAEAEALAGQGLTFCRGVTLALLAGAEDSMVRGLVILLLN